MSKITEIFHQAAEENANRVAFYSYEGRVVKKTYRELTHDIKVCINYFNEHNIRRGTKIFIFAPTSYRLTAFMIAAFRMGVQVMFIDINAKQETFKKLFRKFEPDYALVSNKTRFFRPFFRSIYQIKKTINIDDIEGKATDVELPDIPDDEPALLTTTTGSTGMPKIVVRSHQDLFNQLELIHNNLPKKGRPVVLSTSYIYLFAVLASGDEAVLPLVKLNQPARLINRQLAHYANVPVTMIFTTPVFCLKANNIFKNLEQLYVGGASVNLDQAMKISDKFYKSQNYIVYGATECNIMAHCGLKTYIKNLATSYRSTLGKTFKGVSIRIDDDDNILVSCNALIKGFINDKKEYDERKEEWYNTNDKGFIENDVLYYRGKYNYFVNYKDQRYYNHEIEQFITVSCPEVKKCAVVQKRKRIYVFLTEKTDEIKISDKLHDRFGFKVKYRYIPQIPHDRRHHTKTDYKSLYKLA